MTTWSEDFCSQAIVTASPNVLTSAIKILDANPARKGLILYNNSANSAYIKLGASGNAGTDMSFIMATFTSFMLPVKPIFTGELWAIRNAGSGVICCTELFT